MWNIPKAKIWIQDKKTQNKYPKKSSKTNECFHSTMSTDPYHNNTCIFCGGIKTGLIGSIQALLFQAQFPMYFSSLINKIKYRLVV